MISTKKNYKYLLVKGRESSRYAEITGFNNTLKLYIDLSKISVLFFQILHYSNNLRNRIFIGYNMYY